MAELSDSTAILILATIAGVYFSITGACSVVICRLLWKKRQFQRQKKDRLVQGGSAGQWREYISQSNGPSHLQNGTHSYSQDQRKLPPIDEVGEGVAGRSDDITSVETEARESTAPSKHLWQARRKGKSRTSSKKYLLEETDGGSNWTLTSGNGGNGGLLVSSQTLTTSLPGPVLSQCGRSDVSHSTTPIPRPVPSGSRIPVNPDPHASSASGHHRRHTDANTASGHQTLSQTAGDVTSRELSNVDNNPPLAVVHRAHKQLSINSHSLPRRSTANARALDKQISTGSGTLPHKDVSSGSRPKLRRYASAAPYDSLPSLTPKVLVKPRSGSRKRNSYRVSTLGRTTHSERHASVTSMEMEINYLQMKRGGVRGEGEGEGEEGRRGREEKGEENGRGEGGTRTPSQEPVLMEEILSDVEVHQQAEGMELEQHYTYTVKVDDEQMATMIDLGHDGQDSSCV